MKQRTTLVSPAVRSRTVPRSASLHLARRAATSLALVGLGATLIAPAHADSIVVNGDFASGGASLVSSIPGWNTSGLRAGSIGGIWGVQCSPPLPCNFFDADTAPPTDTLFQTLATQPGTSYRISFGLDTDATGNGEFTVHFGNTVIADLVNPSSTGGFEQLSFIATASGASTTLTFGFNSFLQTAIDNVSVSAVPEPEAMSLLGVGIATLLFSARRRRPSKAS